MFKNIVLGLFVLLSCSFSFAQKDTTIYYKLLPKDRMVVRTSLYRSSLILKLSQANNDGEEGRKSIVYSSNNKLNFGVGLSHPKIPFDIFVGYGLANSSKERRTETKRIDFLVHKYAQKYVVDLFFQRYKGFYIDNSELTLQESNCPNLFVLKVGGMGQYVFNHRKFSYRAAYNQNAKQLKSAGSVLLGASTYYLNFQNDKALEIQSYQLGLSLGHTYNWVLSPRWLFNYSASFGVNAEKNYVKDFLPDKQVKISPNLTIRLSIFYNAPNWSFGFWGFSSIVGFNYDKNMKRSLRTSQVNLTFLKRFDLKSSKH